MIKRGIFLTVVLGITAVTGCTNEKPASTGANPVRVMTFNLRTAAAKDTHPWEKRWAVAKALVNKEKPDIIGTQEGLHNQLTDLEVGLPDYKWIGAGRDGGNQGEFMAIFYNKTRFKPLKQNHFWLSDTPDVPGSKSWGNNYVRMVTWVLFEDLTNQSKFYAVNTHLDHQSETARQRSAELIVKTMETFEPNVPVFLTGDFNAPVGSAPYKYFTVNGKMKDAVLEASERVNHATGTFHNYKGGGTDTIDWILYRGDVSVKRSEKVTFQLNGEYPSDHYPVMTDIVLNKTAVNVK
ncbi:endonuclease/exonuclease/phosphatase family protein [Paenibacillus allorhizosphaerae]|uniref:Endonuclease/exonuclease/phosphatase domain-containing protein n=1 Tax=Paenibacillus allorhizosphaerae TaxID=2849866 RepID=A0ABM8VB44_9BACL|nr:endonuclease/exonuclease/phosphatase family protein [Paenibacillus allorhizosphaerae]CAG7618477.1 hypothetical protein PAECIP111802_00521 [Paenibacillus allorhizosphaerae]